MQPDNADVDRHAQMGTIEISVTGRVRTLLLRNN
jgi:hypothetical protein